MSDYNKDPVLTSILNKMDIFLLPVANPDGYVYTQNRVSRTIWAGHGVKLYGIPCFVTKLLLMVRI